MKKALIISNIVLLSVLISACSQQTIQIEGQIDYLGNQSLILEDIPLHYKYSPAHRETLNVNSDGYFETNVPTSGDEIKRLILGDEFYPLLISPDQDLNIKIVRSDFPKNLSADGYSGNFNNNYQNYLSSVTGIDKSIEVEEEAFKKAKPNKVLSLSRKKFDLAKQHLEGTPLERYYLKTMGEYFVFKIRDIEYKQRFKPSFNADSARTSVMNEASNMGLFTLKTLESQRAGIRDITHYYSRTFGIYDSVKKAYGQDLAEYDIKRIAYEELNKKRLEVLEYIPGRKAEAYARMYLVAERIGELGLDIAEPSYRDYLSEYEEFPEYTDFLEYFYKEIQSVSPGQPAIPFSLPDQEGKFHSMDDYLGNYVLLDFWAGWCQPCLDEFPDMKRLYQKYSQNNFEIVGISIEVDSLVWRKDIQRLNNPWTQLYAGNGFKQKTFKGYKGGGIPFYILVGPDGNILRYNDVRATFNLESVMDSLLNIND